MIREKRTAVDKCDIYCKQHYSNVNMKLQLFKILMVVMIREKSELYCYNIYLQANQKYFSSAAVFLTAKKN